MSFDSVRAVVETDFHSVNELIHQQLNTQVKLIETIASHLINGGGKRIRPLLCLLAARAAGYEGDQHTTIAASVEFLHTATLLHDDVVDQSDLRRGQESANALWGNAPSILVGDFLVSRAFQMLVGTENLRVLHIFADTTNQIAEGEVMQLTNCRNPDTSEAQYLNIIRLKTAKMFTAASQSGAALVKPNSPIETALASYAEQLGMAFQLIDDALDYSGDSQVMGKNIGDDLAEGKPTLPLIYAMREGGQTIRALIRNAIQQASSEQLEAICTAVKASGALEYTRQQARQSAENAKQQLAILEDSVYKEALLGLADLAVNRNS